MLTTKFRQFTLVFVGLLKSFVGNIMAIMSQGTTAY